MGQGNSRVQPVAEASVLGTFRRVCVATGTPLHVRTRAPTGGACGRHR